MSNILSFAILFSFHIDINFSEKQGALCLVRKDTLYSAICILILLYHPSYGWCIGDTYIKLLALVLWIKLSTGENKLSRLARSQASLSFQTTYMVRPWVTLKNHFGDLVNMVCSTHLFPWGIWLMGKLCPKYFGCFRRDVPLKAIIDNLINH